MNPRLNESARGIYVISATPFADDGALDLDSDEQQPGFGLAVRKEVLRRRGALRSAAARTPASRLGPIEHAELDRLLTRLERCLKNGG